MDEDYGPFLMISITARRGLLIMSALKLLILIEGTLIPYYEMFQRIKKKKKFTTFFIWFQII